MEILIYFILFLIVSTACFTLPGIFILNYSKTYFGFKEKIVLGTIIGFVVFTLLSYILLVFKISILLLPIIGLINLVYLKKTKFQRINFKISSKKHLLLLLIVFTIGILGQMAIMAPSGLKINNDLIFYSSNGHDGPWHIALMEEIKKGYPLQNPIFAGERLVNYHFFSDIAPAQFSKYFKFSSLDLYFRFFPFLNSILLGSMAFLLGRKINNSFSTGLWSSFFVYFAGSFGYFVTFFKNHVIGGESIFWATQIQSSIGNPPQIISDILVLTIIYFLCFFPKKNWGLSGILIVVIGSLAVFKIYASVVVLISLLLVGLVELFKDKKIYLLCLFILSSLLSAILYLPNTANSTSFLIFEPWWFIRTMIVVDSRLDWIDLELKRQTYFAERNWKRVFQIELTGFLLFFFGNLGTKFLGLIFIAKSIKKILNNLFFQLSFSIAITSLILPLLFLQKGVAKNTIQFLQYFLLIFGVYAAITTSGLQNRIKNNLLRWLFITLIIIFSVPTQIGVLYDFYHKPPIAKITPDEIQALNYLRENSDKNSIVLTSPFNKYSGVEMATPFIWAWFDTSYVAAFSQRRIYLADLEQVDIMGYNYKERLNTQKIIFENNQRDKVWSELKNNKISYVYFPKKVKPVAYPLINSTLVFENGQIEIWKIN